jgi:hypothetical protein
MTLSCSGCSPCEYIIKTIRWSCVREAVKPRPGSGDCAGAAVACVCADAAGGLDDGAVAMDNGPMAACKLARGGETAQTQGSGGVGLLY